MLEQGMVTIRDILSEVPVTSRTIRNWTRAGLLPPPVKKGLGKGKGTVAYYPPETLEKARFIHNLREYAKTPELKKRLVRMVGSSKIYIYIDECGRLTLRYTPKSFQEGDDELERV